MNTIIILGNAGRDPDLRFTPSGQAVCDVSIADSIKSGGEEKTTWFKIIAWGKTGEAMNKYVSKGDKIQVVGRLSEVHFTGRDGEDRTSLEVTASHVEFLGRRTKSEEKDQTSDFLGEDE